MAIHLEFGPATILVTDVDTGRTLNLISLWQVSFSDPTDITRTFSAAEYIPASEVHVVNVHFGGNVDQWDVRDIDDGTTYPTTADLIDDIKAAIDALNTGGGGTYTADGTTLELTGTQFAIKDGGVRTMQIADAVVTLAKIQDIGQNRMLGRVSSGSGVPEQLTPSQARDVLDVEPDGSTLEISSGNMRVKDAGVTLAKMANMATASLLGRNTAGTGVPEVLSASTVRALLDLEVGTDVQAYDSDLAAIAALSPSNDDILQRKSGAWTNRTVAQLAADMGRSSAVLGSDFTTSSAGPSDVTGWSLTLADPGTYLITIAAFVSSSNNSTGVSLSVTISGSPTLRSLDRTLYTAGTTKIHDVVSTDDAGTVPTTMSGLNVPRPCMFVGMVKTSGSSATIQMRIARGGSSNNVSALAGSAIIAQKIE
jgi:hypothetical protein